MNNFILFPPNSSAIAHELLSGASRAPESTLFTSASLTRIEWRVKPSPIAELS